MFALKNKVQLIGNLGNTPEIKTLETGKKMARFSVATSEVYRNAKGEKSRIPSGTTWWYGGKWRISPKSTWQRAAKS